jgi:hypothetical protein
MSVRRVLLGAAGLLAFVWTAAAGDLWLRARSAYREGEKYLEWDRHPEMKKAHFDARLDDKVKALTAERDGGRLPADQYEKKVYLARFERDQAVSESSLKYAYVWFQSAAELFAPPENRWTRAARGKLASTREAWKRELDVRKIPYQDYMLE